MTWDKTSVQNLKTASGLSVRAMAAWLEVSKSTLSGWLAGTQLPYRKRNIAALYRLAAAVQLPRQKDGPPTDGSRGADEESQL